MALQTRDRKPSLAIAIGVPKEPPSLGRPGSDRQAPSPSASPDGGGEPDADDQALDPSEVGYGENDPCETCANMGDDGSCTKYHFQVSRNGHCLAGYRPKDGGGAGDLGGGNSPEGGGDYSGGGGY